MAQRVTQFAKRSVAKNARSDEPARATNVPLVSMQGGRSEKLARASRMTTAREPVHLDLAPIVAPHARYGRVSIRIERVPARARFSKGRNNGDRSWSLLPEDLGSLHYFPPEGHEAHTLGVRVISLEGGDGSTLAFTDYDVPASTDANPSDDAPVTIAPSADDEGRQGSELQKLRAELTRTTALLSVRDSELAQARGQNEREWAELSTKAVHDELTIARASWQMELERQVAALNAQAANNLEKERAAWKAEHAADRAHAKDMGLAQAEHQWRQKAAAELAKAERIWKADEDARFATAEAHWREQFARVLLDAKNRLEQSDTALAEARSQFLSGEKDGETLKALRGELISVKAAMAGRDQELSRLRTAHEEAQRQWQQESERQGDERLRELRRQLNTAQSALASREQDIGHIEASHAEAQRLWQQNAERDSEQKLQPLREELDTARSALARREWDMERLASAHEDEKQRWLRNAARDGDSKLRQLQEQLEATQDDLQAEKERLNKTQSAHDTERTQWKKDAALAHAQAEAGWRKDEALRMAALRVQLQSEAAQELEAMRAHADQMQSLAKAKLDEATSHASDTSAELLRLRGQLEAGRGEKSQLQGDWEKERAGLQAVLGQYQADLARMHSAAESLRAAQASEKTRVLSRDAALKEEHDRALAELRHAAENERGENGKAIDALRAEAQAEITARENELAQLRSAAERIHERAEKDAQTALEKARRTWRIEEAERLQQAKSRWQIQADKTLAKVTARLQYTERALTEARGENTAAQQQLGQQTPAASDEVTRPSAEVEQARVASQEARAMWEAEAQHLLATQAPGSAFASTPGSDVNGSQKKFRMMAFGGAALFACAAAPALYFAITGSHRAAQPTVALPVQTTATQQSTVTLIRSAKVHAGPAVGSPTLAQLPRDATLEVTGQRGKWTMVRSEAIKTTTHAGWVFNTYLKTNPPIVAIKQNQ